MSASGVFCVLKRETINNFSYFSQHAEVPYIYLCLHIVMGTEMCSRMVLSLTVVLFSDGFSVQFN